MIQRGIPAGRWLDPRPAAEAAARPITDSVNIPRAELPGRTHELPRPTTCIYVAGPADLVTDTVAWLNAHGRRAEAATSLTPVTADSEPTPRRLWSPNDLLLEALPQLAPGRALDLACGTGRDAVYLAACGWDVTAIDVLPDAIERATSLAARYPSATPHVRWLAADIERNPGVAAGKYDLIIMFRYLHRPLLPMMYAWLRPGGTILCEVFTPTHRTQHGKPADARRTATSGDLAACLPMARVISATDAWREAEHTARLWACTDSAV